MLKLNLEVLEDTTYYIISNILYKLFYLICIHGNDFNIKMVQVKTADIQYQCTLHTGFYISLVSGRAFIYTYNLGIRLTI